jgi:hypothetical protein
MRRKILFGMAILLVAGLMGQCALARDDGDSHRALRAKWWKIPKVAQELQLSKEQTSAIEAIFNANRKRFVDLTADIKKAAIDLDLLMEAETYKAEEVAAAIDALYVKRAAAKKAQTLMLLEMRDQLSVEQREKLKELREQWRHKRLAAREARKRRAPDHPPRNEQTPAPPR